MVKLHRWLQVAILCNPGRRRGRPFSLRLQFSSGTN